MDAPIYSNDKRIETDCVLQKRVILLLSDKVIQNINYELSIVDHGIFFFPQYKEKKYIINSFPEEVFWNIVSRLYALLHDCGGKFLYDFFECVSSDGKQLIKPFPVTTNNDQVRLLRVQKFIVNLENLRHTEQHNMKPDSLLDRKLENNRRNIFKKIVKKEILCNDEWEQCISWLKKESDNLYTLLYERVQFLKEDATDLQKESLIGRYYNCLENYYERIMADVFKEVNYKKRKSCKGSYIKAMINKHQGEIIEQSLILLKKSSNKIDPYKVILQVVDSFI